MKRIFLFFVIALILCGGAFAQKNPAPLWGNNGIVVNDTQGNTTQQHPVLVKLGTTEYLTAFEDYRSGNADIYIQKFDYAGNGEKDGKLLCAAGGDQLYPAAVGDGAGGAFIVWQDNRGGNFDIYLQRLDSSGNPELAPNGIPLCTAPEGQFFPKIISDGQGGAIVAWHDYRTKEEDIYAQRVDRNGSLLWGAEGVAACKEKATQWFPALTSDERGGAIIAWADRRNGNFDIYAQHIDYAGKTSWNADGIPVCVAPGNQENPRIAVNGEGGAFISWSNSGGNEDGSFAQRIDASGRKTFADAGVKIANYFTGPTAAEIAYDGAKGTVIVWSSSHAGDADIYAQRVSRDGELLWGEEGNPLARVQGIQENPKIFGASPFYVLWEDLRSGKRQLYLQKININARQSFPRDGLLVADGGRAAQSAGIVIDGDDSVALCFEDNKHGNFDIYAQRIDKAGSLLFGPYGKLLNNATGAVIQQNYRTTKDNRNNLYFAFEDKRSGYTNIYAQKLNAEGSLIWGFDAIPVIAALSEQINPGIAADDRGGAYIAWEDHSNPSGSMICVQHVNAAGKLLFAEGLVLTPKAAVFNQKKPRIIPDNTGGAIIVFVDMRGSFNETDIYAQRVNAKGELLWGGGGIAVTKGNGNQDDPVIVPYSFVAAWTDYRNGERNSDIYAQKMDLSGRTLWQEDGIPVCEAPDSQRDPSAINDGEKGVIIVWTDKGGGSFDVYAQRVNINGQPLWLKDGVPVCQTGMAQQRPRLVLTEPGQSFVIWEDFRFGAWDIFAQVLSAQGRIGISEEGTQVCAAAGTQYNPSLIRHEKNVIIAWEDYRSSLHYDVYMQALNFSGGRIWHDGGVPVAFDARLPQLVSIGRNEFIAAWEDYKNGARSIAAQKFKL